MGESPTLGTFQSKTGHTYYGWLYMFIQKDVELGVDARTIHSTPFYMPAADG